MMRPDHLEYLKLTVLAAGVIYIVIYVVKLGVSLYSHM